MQGISQKIKTADNFSNQEIGLVFPKVHHHGCQQEKSFWYNSYNAGKHHLGKEIFQSMTLYNTHKLPLRNIFVFVYHKLGWDME